MLACLCITQVTTAAPKSPSNVHHSNSSEANAMSNDVQRDQGASQLQKEKTAHDVAATAANAPTELPFLSFPVTKTPGRSVENGRGFKSLECIQRQSFELFSCLHKQKV